MKNLKISVVGTGYVGLTTAVCFSKLGFEVTCIDVIEEKVRMINSGKSPIYEDKIDDFLREALEKGMTVTTDYSKVADTDISFICVGTPMSEDGSMNSRYIESAAESIGKAVKEKEKHVVVIKSTVVPGTNRRIGDIIRRNAPDTKISMVSNPEFLQEGKAINDFMNPDRVVIGGDNEEAVEQVSSLYGDISKNIMKTNLETAELIKYVSNTFLATKISFINEIANLCEKIPGVDAGDVAEGVGMDSRISPRFLRAGIGYGGSCFPKDVKALIKFAKDNSVELKIPSAAEKINKQQPLRVIEILDEELNGKLGKTGILGTAFKPGTDDVRESPSLAIIPKLLDKGEEIAVYDPEAMENTKKIFGDKIKYFGSAEEAVKFGDTILILTEWPEFSKIDKSLFEGKLIIDGRRIFSKDKIKSARYRTIGNNYLNEN